MTPDSSGRFRLSLRVPTLPWERANLAPVQQERSYKPGELSTETRRQLLEASLHRTEVELQGLIEAEIEGPSQ